MQEKNFDTISKSVEKNKQVVIVQAISSGFNGGNYAEITLNGSKVWIEKNDHNHFRGLHIVIINPLNGKLLFGQVFDTHV